jgi:hypothetical protein
MDHEATTAAFHITPAAPGRFEWRETTLIFWPEPDYLPPSTRITATIDTTARGADGESLLRRPYTWSFNTNSLNFSFR